MAKINLGVPYYCSQESAWGEVEGGCPNVAEDLNVCKGAMFVGKAMNRRLGQFAQRQGFGGVFPWMANYDTSHHNNSLIPYLVQGLYDTLPPAVRRTPLRAPSLR